jgi:hypothetical protein
MRVTFNERLNEQKGMSKEEKMNVENSVSGNLGNVYLVGLSVVVGVFAAVTAVLVLWIPMAKLAARFF